MININIKLNDIVSKWLVDNKEKSKASMDMAVRVESFRIMNDMRGQLARGTIGGQALRPLSFIARRLFVLGGKKDGKSKPLQGLRGGILYRRISDSVYDIGFTGEFGRSEYAKRALLQQGGFRSPVSDKQRRFFMHKGAELIKKSKFKRRDLVQVPFFLKKSTQFIVTPARPIVEPYFDANKSKIKANIIKNFRMKMAGKHI